MDNYATGFEMTLNGYQRRAHRTARYKSEHAIEYLALGLASEAGEVAGKVKKAILAAQSVNTEHLAFELGDVFWYLSELAGRIGYPLEQIAEMNLDKLASRAERDKIVGDGDDR